MRQLSQRSVGAGWVSARTPRCSPSRAQPELEPSRAEPEPGLAGAEKDPELGLNPAVCAPKWVFCKPQD